MSLTEPVGDALAAMLSTCATSQLWAEQDEGPYRRSAPRRRDLVDDRDGRALQLGIRLTARDGTPVEDAVVEVWHCDALGRYSGFPPPDDSVVVSAADAPRGEYLPDQTFLRGSQRIDASGLVEFHTIHPGWYPGRTVHIHVLVHIGETTLTSQLYLPDDLNEEVLAQDPYSRRPGRDTTNDTDEIFPTGGEPAVLDLVRDDGANRAAICLVLPTAGPARTDSEGRPPTRRRSVPCRQSAGRGHVAIESVEDAARRWAACSPDERARLGPTLIAVAGDAVRELAGRLAALGYPVDGMVVPCDALDDALEQFEGAGPPVPPALVEVWRRIGAVTFVDLGRYRHLAFWDERLGAEARVHACDGVVVEGPVADDGWIDYVIDLFDEQEEVGLPPAFPLGPDALHKDNTSGGDGYELVPDPGDPWLASIREFAWTGPARPVTAPPGSSPDLVSYLRSSILECAGFPGLLGVQAFEPLRRELVDGLAVF